jgi:hypothetical protein
MCGVYSRVIPPCNRMGEASQRPHHFLKKRRHLRQNYVKTSRFWETLKITLKVLSVRGLPTTALFFSYGTEQLWLRADACNKKKKKAVTRRPRTGKIHSKTWCFYVIFDVNEVVFLKKWRGPLTCLTVLVARWHGLGLHATLKMMPL